LVASTKKSSKNRVRTAVMSRIRCIPHSPLSSTSAGFNSPLASRVKKSTPTARTSGSAKGSLIRGWADRLANARPTATPVAVAPTLEAKSQVSLSVRAFVYPSPILS
jgi:hypothetical protein